MYITSTLINVGVYVRMLMIMYIHTIGWHSEDVDIDNARRRISWIECVIWFSYLNISCTVEWSLLCDTSNWVRILISVWSTFYLWKMRLHKCSENLRHINWESGSCLKVSINAISTKIPVGFKQPNINFERCVLFTIRNCLMLYV